MPATKTAKAETKTDAAAKAAQQDDERLLMREALRQFAYNEPGLAKATVEQLDEEHPTEEPTEEPAEEPAAA